MTVESDRQLPAGTPIDHEPSFNIRAATAYAGGTYQEADGAAGSVSFTPAALDKFIEYVLGAASSAPSAWQCRTIGRTGWEDCTEEMYEAIKRTGRYAGYASGPLAESRALFTAPSAAMLDGEVVGWALKGVDGSLDFTSAGVRPTPADYEDRARRGETFVQLIARHSPRPAASLPGDVLAHAGGAMTVESALGVLDHALTVLECRGARATADDLQRVRTAVAHRALIDGTEAAPVTVGDEHQMDPPASCDQ